MTGMPMSQMMLSVRSPLKSSAIREDHTVKAQYQTAIIWQIADAH